MDRLITLLRRCRFVPFVTALVTAALCLSLRTSNLPRLHERYALDNDSYRFLRIAEQDVAGQPLGSTDRMRWRPEGRDMRTHLSLHSHLLAAVYGALHATGVPLSFRSFALRYPLGLILVCGALLAAISYRLSGPGEALLPVVGLAVAPPMLLRSSAGFIDRDPFCLLLILLTYLAYQHLLNGADLREGVIAGGACGIAAGLLGLAWEGSGLFTLPLAVTLAWLALTGRLRTTVVAGYISLTLVLLPLVLAPSGAYRDLYTPYVLLALVPLPLVTGAAALATHWSRKGNREPIPRLPQEIACAPGAFLGGLATLTLLAGAAFGVSHRGAGAALAFLDNTVKTIGTSRLLVSVVELHEPTLLDWWSTLGLGLPLMLGSLFLAARWLRRQGGNRSDLYPAATVGAALLILTSNDLAGWVLHDQVRRAAGLMRMLALLAWFLASARLSRRAAGQESEEEPPGRTAFLFLLISCWMIVSATAAGSSRYDYFLTPFGWLLVAFAAGEIWVRLRGHVTRATAAGQAVSLLAAGAGLAGAGLSPICRSPGVLLAAAGIMALGGWLLSRDLRRWRTSGEPRRWVLITGIVSLLALTTATEALAGGVAMSRLRPQLTWLIPSLEEAGRSLPPDATLLAWWVYGSYINVFAQRGTYIDEDHFRPERISEVAREVFCANDPARAVQFMRARGINDWLITGRDITDLETISWLAADPAPGVPLEAYRFEPEAGSRDPGSRLQASDPVPIRDPSTLAVLGAGRVQAVPRVMVLQGPARQNPPSVRIETEVNGQLRVLVPEIVVLDGVEYPQTGVDRLPGAALLRRDPLAGGWRAMYVPHTVSRFLVVRLFLFGERIPGFRPVPTVQMPADPFATRPTGIGIWEVAPARRAGSDGGVAG